MNQIKQKSYRIKLLVIFLHVPIEKKQIKDKNFGVFQARLSIKFTVVNRVTFENYCLLSHSFLKTER